MKLVACCAALALATPAAWAADARHPYAHVNHANDAGNATGDAQVEALNQAQLAHPGVRLAVPAPYPPGAQPVAPAPYPYAYAAPAPYPYAYAPPVPYPYAAPAYVVPRPAYLGPRVFFYGF